MLEAPLATTVVGFQGPMIRGNVSGLSFGNISFEFGGGWLRVNEYGLPQYQAGYGPIPEPFPPHLGNGFAFPGSCVMWGKHHRASPH